MIPRISEHFLAFRHEGYRRLQGTFARPPISPRGRSRSGRPAAIRLEGRGHFVARTFGLRLLTAHPPQDYITHLRRASVFGRDVAPAKHLTDIR